MSRDKLGLAFMKNRILLILLFALISHLSSVSARQTLLEAKQDRSNELGGNDKGAKHFDLKRSMSVESSDEIKREAGEAIQCDVTLNLEYEQHNEQVKVYTTVWVNDCQNAYGEYDVRVYYDDGSDDLKKLTFTETWEQAGQSESGEAYVSEDFYTVGSEVYVSRVRGLLPPSNSCWCRPSAAKGESN